MEQVSKGLIWMERELDVKTEANIMKEKLHAVREKYQKANYAEIKGNNKSFIEWNEDLLSFCKANRRKYQMENRTEKIDRQIFELQMIISQKEEEIEKLRDELKEERDNKDHALNRLDDLLKHGNPEISDLSDENRPTNLGQRFKQLYEEEWTDAFEFLTEKRETDLRVDDRRAIGILYEMLKRCEKLCEKEQAAQHLELATLVRGPCFFKADVPKIQEKYSALFMEFFKGIADETLKYLPMTDLVVEINKDGYFQHDILQNPEIRTYLQKCFNICWLMLAQHPPMLMDFETKSGHTLDINVFEPYSSRGPIISEVVWPPVYLHKGGPLVCKGYSEGSKKQ
ncbi:hyaluronan-mediated motility receptor-like [Ruditapes philippinarum]|uniref:hyaluronan-mediated motility receptor-like n=1 Tax=Ruditapes philippinarum TaxID=129788 RepID=UPI00295A7364|nr:hyaluronan-mediated motility receptor-like [Ruditapes philippinarum]